MTVVRADGLLAAFVQFRGHKVLKPLPLASLVFSFEVLWVDKYFEPACLKQLYASQSIICFIPMTLLYPWAMLF